MVNTVWSSGVKIVSREQHLLKLSFCGHKLTCLLFFTLYFRTQPSQVKFISLRLQILAVNHLQITGKPIGAKLLVQKGQS